VIQPIALKSLVHFLQAQLKKELNAEKFKNEVLSRYNESFLLYKNVLLP